MLIFPENRFAFIHIPKSAGTSIRTGIKQAMEPFEQPIDYWGVTDGIDMAHPLPAHVEAKDPYLAEILFRSAYNSIAILRDPIDRFISAFNEHKKQFARSIGSVKSKEDYLEAVKNRKFEGPSGYMYIHGAPQVEFVTHERISWSIELLMFDDPLLFEKISILIGSSVPKLKLNPTAPASRPYLSKHFVERLLDVYEMDYALIESCMRGSI